MRSSTYLQSVKPVSNKVPDPIYKMPSQQQIFPGAEKPIDPADLERQSQARFLSRGHRPLHGVPYAAAKG